VTDPKAEDADAGDPQLPPVPKNEQFANLNRLRRERTWVDVFLIGGTCLHGQIRSFDASMMLLQTRSGDIGLYHHAISTVVRAQKRGGGKAFKPRQNRDVREKPVPLRARPTAPPDYGEPLEPPRRVPDRPPVVIVKQRRARSVIKPE
jgi:RNA chaperone Hfq